MEDSIYNKELKLENFNINKKIGKGAFSEVFSIEYNNIKYA